MTSTPVPTLNKFRTSLTKGADYTNPAQPEAIQLTISQNGKTNREAEIHIARCGNLKNEWNMLESEAAVHTAKNNAHRATYEAMTSEINAGTAFINAQTAWYGFKGAEARATVAQGEMNLAISSVPFQLARQGAELQKVVLQLEQTLLEVNKIRDDVAHVRIMNNLNGYNTEIALPQGVGAEIFTSNLEQPIEPETVTSSASSASPAADMLNRAKEWMTSTGSDE